MTRAERDRSADQRRPPPSRLAGDVAGLSAASASELTHWLLQLSFQVQGAVAKAASCHDLSTVQTRLLGVLRYQRPTMTELARLLELEKSSLTGLIDRAEKVGMVVRVRQDADRRCVRVKLTPDGERRAAEVHQCLTERVAELLRRSTSAERRRLLYLLRVLLR